MAGETQQMHSVKELDAESKQQDEGTVLEQQSDKTTKASSEHFSSRGTEARLGTRGAKAEKLEKDRDCPQQREAVIRPQQTGKIDFSSLQNRTKFVTDRTWSSGKGSPQSPSGKGRSREKGKRSGKTERGNPQQLYRLSITNPRTIGIAYPQQKVLPPKKLEPSRGPVSGSYRLNVPTMPEREVELQQQELSYSRYFQENPSSITSSSYTSQALGSSSGPSSHSHPSLSQQQQQASMDTNSTLPGSQLMMAECPLSGSNVWQSPERTYNGSNYGISSQKSTALSETGKTSAFVPAKFQYGYHLLEQSIPESFASDQNPQPQITHNVFSFSPGNGQNTSQNSSQFSADHQPDRSSYPNPQQAQFIQGVESSIQCSRTLSEDSPSSDSSGSSSQQSEQGKTALPESSDTSSQADCQDAAVTSGSNRNCHPKDAAASQRTLIQAGVQARNISQSPGSPMHFPNRTFSNPPANSMRTSSTAFDKSINSKVVSRLAHSWEGPDKTYSAADQNTNQYSVMNEKFQFQNQTAIDHRPNSSKSNRMPWQQIRLNSAMPNQKLAYMVSPSDWQDESKGHKHNSFQSSRSGDVLSNQRHETTKHNSTTSTSTISAFKLDMNHAQLCEAKNKSVYFGLNQTIPTAPSRNYSYPPLQIPPLGLSKVSPYESPLPSPIQNPASSGTCSSLSPASTSPINISSEDSQVSKSAPPHLFYQPPQVKTQLQLDHMNMHSHQVHSNAPQSLPYTPDRAKDEAMSYLQNSTHPKAAMDSNKGYVDSFGVEHHQPPPPYSAHPLFASSLATANLDQLDVLLTCKQCDQNFSNLASFLGHKQYCPQNTLAQNELKDLSKMEDNRKFHAEPVKAALPVSNTSFSRCPSDLHLSLLGLNKNGELISDSEAKGDSKDDPLKLGLFSGPSNLPVPLPELEMEDAKLDSLITEALNGLVYQSDNVEIDSSFIDAFVDDDLTTVKSSSNKLCLKTKESALPESKNKQGVETSFAQEKCYDSDAESKEKMATSLQEDEKIYIKKDGSHKNSKIASREKAWEQESKVKETRKLCKSEDKNTSPQRFLLSGKFSEHCGLKSFQDRPALRGSAASQASTSPTSRAAAKESKRKSTGGGTWSKELIHKIVQQKNKLHKLHVKGSKNLQFSLVMERLTPTAQNPAFGEYDYVSDSDDECEPVKIASQGRLNQSSRCKYTYTKQCKWRARSEREQAAWRHESKECFEMKKSKELSLTPEKHQRLRRRGSRSSTSSDLSTSVSPKSTDRTDSDSERKKDSPEQKSHDRSTSQKLFKESSTLALTFTKSVKKYNIDKTKYSENKEIAEDPEKYSNQEVPDLLASPQKLREAVKNSEKRGSSQAKSRDKLVPQKTESSSGVNTLQRIDKPNSEGGPSRYSSTDNKTLEVESPPPAITGEADLNVDRNTKDKTGREPKAAQLRLSGSATLEKQSESVCMVKEAIILVNDLDGHRPTSFCTSLINEVCLTPTESQSPLIQKDALDLMPYPMDQEQGLIKSPLSFDTSSMFGDLAGFDSGLYSEIPIQKDSFHSVESTADKKEAFVSSFSPFMEPRDWNLMVNPILRDEISQYKGISEKSNKKKSDYSHISSSLPEKIIDYSANLSSCASEDELEIKRIVNELENQLQTTKLESPPLLIQEASKQLQMSKFSPLRGADNSEREGNRLNIKCSAQTIDCSEPFTNPELPWSSTFQFDLIGEKHSHHTQIQSEAAALKPEHLHRDKTLGQSTDEIEAPAETKEDIIEQRRYTENLMKSLEVISDSIFQKEPIISEHKEPNINSPTSQQHEEAECQAPDGAGREDCCEKEAITAKESISSLPNISEQKDEIEIILDKSQSSVPNDADPSFGGKQPVSLQKHETTEIEYHDADTRVASDVKSARCSASSEGDDSNQLIKRNSDCRENREEPAAEEITHQPEGHPSSPAPADPTQEIGKKMADVIKAALEQQYANDSNNPEGISSSQAAESKVGEIMETSTQGNLIAISASESSCPSNAYTKLNMSLEIVNKDKPCSPELVKTNPEKCCSPFHDTQSAEGQSNQLILSQSDGIIDGNACKVTPFNEPLKTDMGLIFAKQEEILNVQDIKEHFPVDFMASQQNSPCREAAEESCCVFLDSVSPASPLLLISHQTPTEKFDLKGDLNAKRKFSNECIVQRCQNPKSPIIKDHEVAVNGDSSKTAAEMDCSLISTPQMDCRMIPTSETISSSPVPASHTAEPPEVKEDEKGDLMYDLKLSPLNYNDLSDEPSQLNQYDYIPISPASKPEEDLDTKQRPTESCESCDLSVNPALIFNQTETEATMPLGSDPEAKLQSSDEPLVLQQSIKFTCFSLGLKPDIPKTDSSGDNPKISLQVFHDPVQPVEDVRIQADLLTEAASVNLDSHKASFEDCALPKKAEPLIVCENEKVPLPPEKQLTLERSPCSAGQQTHKETTHKKSQSSDPPGKVLCEICFMCFRSVPGLKRHKAMKHVVRAEKCSQSTTLSHQGTVLIYEAPVNKQKDDSQRCFPATKIDGLPEISGSLTSKTAEMESILEEKDTEISSMAADEISHQNPPLQAKAKKNNKGRKNKSSQPNPDPFSDELLKILKTDILQAITPEFKSSALQEQSKSPEGKICDRTVARTEEFLHRATADPAFNSETQTPEPNTLSETVEHDQFGETKVTEMVYLETCTEGNVERVSVENEIIGDYDETEQKGSEDSLALEILRNISTDMKCPSDNINPLSCLNSSSPSPPGMSSDLKAILDDDTTFSQLFPRDEEAKRKKCPRVYSKRHKRQKLSITSEVAADYLPTDTFMQNKDQCGEPQSVQTISDQQSNRCEYETISIDDTIMLNMCHNSTLKADGKPMPDFKQNNQQDVCELGNNLLNPLESTVNKSTVEWSLSSDFTGFKSCPIVTSESSDSKHEEPLPAAPCTVEPHAAEGAQSFQTIDIQNINTTFQIPEMQFFDSEKDVQVAPLPEAADTDGKEDEKSKKETERRGRKRQDGGMKVKDKQYKCKVCFTWFLTLGELNFHKLSHNPSPPPTCYMCVQRKFSSREQLRDHLREKHAKNKTGIWTCGMCLKEISDVWMYNEHLREHATQFARRGQAQGSMLGISGCFMQETAVKNFISSIMQQRPSKANRESGKATKEQEKAATGFGKFSEGAETKAHKTKSSTGGGGKQSTLAPIEVLHKTETPKSVEMHPNCKDPSRDCHHCGKQFPKPFKLQRHLVVHNLERIFLCHKCPISYQEAQDLKEHLRRAHEEVDDLDSKHTTLYTCELCADVMHVIKKSFICSTCNYTFSKKEQFDRHMEKHLSGGNKIFKFRGVLRPVKASASKENECDSPVSKRIRVLSDSLPENSSDSGIASFSSLHLNQNADAQSLKPCVSTADDSTQTIPNEHQGDSSNANVKTEDVTADCCQLLEDLENCIHLSSSGSTTPKKEKSDVTVLPHLDKEANGKSIPESCDVKEENESVCIRTEATSCSVSKESSMAGEEEVVKDKTDLPPAVLENSSVCSTENQIFLQTPESSELAVDEVSQQGDDEQRLCTLSCNDTKQQALSHGAEQESSSQMKNNAAPATMPENTKTIAGAGCAKAMEATATPQHKVSLLASTTTDDKDLVKPQKRRKDVKSTNIMQRVSSSVTQENYVVDPKPKKKFRPSKCANPSLQRKSNLSKEYPVLSSVRDDVVSNKIISKCKNVNLSLQARRGLLESCAPKKPDTITPQNGELKAKRGPLGRSVHMSKVPSVSMNNSLNKPRPKTGVRTVDSNSFRTAESQNHILSQLFGQKLTSFKIPLRKDTSESIN